MSDSKTCSREGCGKKLRPRNKKGVCSSGCLSPDAPRSLRAKGTGQPGPAQAASLPSSNPQSLVRFRVVAEALGKDPDALLEEFAQGWLDELRGRVE